ncbi:MAG TPA: nuclear transport factor 2 family protein [Nannocystis sp.]
MRSSRNKSVFMGALMFAVAVCPWQSAGASEEAYSWESFGLGEVNGLKARVQRLEDIEEIKFLKHRYIVLIDEVIADPSAAVEFVSLFADDFVVEYDNFGVYTDKADLQEFLEDVISPAFAWGFHAAHNPRIEVDGDEATAEWYFTADAVYTGTNETVPFYGRYVDTYVRTCEGWKISSTILAFDSPPLL